MNLYYYSLLIFALPHHANSYHGYHQLGRLHQSSSKLYSSNNNNSIRNPSSFLSANNNNNNNNNNEKCKKELRSNNNRRKFLANSASLILGVVTTTSSSKPVEAYNDEDNENILLSKKGVLEGRWMDNDNEYKIKNKINNKNDNSHSNTQYDIPATFITYASRIMIHYDYELFTLFVKDKNNDNNNNNNIHIDEDVFGSFAMSVQIGLEKFMNNNDNNTIRKTSSSSSQRYEELANILINKYGTIDNGSIVRHIGILFSLLPKDDQPIEFLQSLKNKKQNNNIVNNMNNNRMSNDLNIFLNDPTMLLPDYYTFVYDTNTNSFIVNPPIEGLLLYNNGNGNIITSNNNIEESDNNNLSTITSTPFRPRSNTPLKRDRPNYNPYIYSLLALSGGISCAITHTIVIPLDVVKTRLQTDDLTKIQLEEKQQQEESSSTLTMSSKTSSSSYPNTGMISYARYIIETEGIEALLLGTQATIAGFFWYGITVYPSYLFFKRFFSNIVMISLSSDIILNIDTINTIISLLSGALASVIASIGLTPLEACRIRTVAQPETYKTLGLSGTIAALGNEDQSLGYKLLYAGFPSLVTRQVIFGSIKFLTFERTCAYITSTVLSSSYGMTIYNQYTFLPFVISLLSGAVAGTLSSIISQPADSVLTYVSKQKNVGNGSGSNSVIEGAKIMIENEGISSLFRGLGSRCLWAGCIIAGQFGLYDVFRSLFGVSGDNLSQVLEVVISP